MVNFFVPQESEGLEEIREGSVAGATLPRGGTDYSRLTLVTLHESDSALIELTYFFVNWSMRSALKDDHMRVRNIVLQRLYKTNGCDHVVLPKRY